ncbi:MAG: methyltransferase domain-containing protein [Verrucomicrobia bacterium]|nr:methyltransferase domain-containing protein [Verrucomicrobiota bacterium]
MTLKIKNKKIDFWKYYPICNRKNISLLRVKVSNKLRKKLQKFPKEYFDGKREHGYGGYYYNPKFFRKIVKAMIKHYKLDNTSKILDIGCAKGFMMYEFKKALPRCEIKGIDISTYCKKKALEKIKKFIKIGTCEKLPYPNKYFDFVVSISTIHNVTKNGIKRSLKEIIRVSKKNSFIRIKAYKNIQEKKKIDNWNVVAKSNLSEKNWFKLFKETNYKGDFQFSKF